MTTEYRNFDAPSRPQAVTVNWELLTADDDCSDAPDERQDGFWPSLDESDAGYIGGNPARDFETQHAAAVARMKAWHDGDWNYVGVMARGHFSVPIGGGSFTTITLDSPGLWGIESDAGDYLKEVFEQEKAELLRHLKTLGAWAIEQTA